MTSEWKENYNHKLPFVCVPTVCGVKAAGQFLEIDKSQVYA